MSEYDVDVEVFCRNDECEHPTEFENFYGCDGKTHEWECPGCGTVYEFEIEFIPDTSGFREKGE